MSPIPTATTRACCGPTAGARRRTPPAISWPTCTPGMSVLDVGCGPGTITGDLARAGRPGSGGRHRRLRRDHRRRPGPTRPAPASPSLSFEVGDLFDLQFADGAFDVVHAHQVLQHVGDPVAALVEMRRVCRPGGLVAARDGDYPGFRYFPDDPDLARAIAAYGELTRRNGANWDAGRRLLSLGPRGRVHRGDPVRLDLVLRHPGRPGLVGRPVGRPVHRVGAGRAAARPAASPPWPTSTAFAAAWRRWAAAPDGWFVGPARRGPVHRRDLVLLSRTSESPSASASRKRSGASSIG